MLFFGLLAIGPKSLLTESAVRFRPEPPFLLKGLSLRGCSADGRFFVGVSPKDFPKGKGDLRSCGIAEGWATQREVEAVEHEREEESDG